jgi:E3 ubiquitin-protein ligase RNF14
LRKVSHDDLPPALVLTQISTDPTIIHCPVQICQTPVSAPQKDSDEEATGWDKLRTCPSCAYSFCAFCRRTWHGPISDCPLSAMDTFVDEYMALPERSTERILLEQRYGKANIIRLVTKREEEKANWTWLESSATACPSCDIFVEKSAGCNHVSLGSCLLLLCLGMLMSTMHF